jgi:hypothetical protein
LTSSVPPSEREPNDQSEVQRIHDAFIEENQPVGINEGVLVYQMAEYFLFQRHASALLGDQFTLADGAGNNNREIALMLRYHTTAVRGFSKALNDLRKLQKERKLQEIGFVSQEVEQPVAEPPVETPARAADSPVPPAEPLKPKPVTAASPVHTTIRVEPAPARPPVGPKNVEKPLQGQPATPPRAA